MKLCIDADTIFRHVNRGLICRPLQSQVESDSNNDIGDVEIDAQGYCDTSGVQSLCVHLNMCNVVVGVNSPGNLSSVALCSRSIRLQPRLHRRRERRTRLLRHQRRAIVVRRSRHLHCRGWRQFQASKQASNLPPSAVVASIRPQRRQHRRRDRRTRLLRHQRGAIVVRLSHRQHCRGWRQFPRRSVAGVKVIVLCSCEQLARSARRLRCRQLIQTFANEDIAKVESRLSSVSEHTSLNHTKSSGNHL